MKIKLISVLLTFVTLLCFVSCNGESAVTGDTTKSEDTSSQTTAEEEFFLPDFSDKSDVLSINGRNVTYEEYRYYFLNMKDVYDRGDDAFWEENDYTEEIKKAVLNYLARQYAVEDLAAQYDIKLSEEDYEEIEGMIASNKSDFANESEYNKYLDYLNLTEDSNYRLATVYMLEEKLYEYLTGEESDFVIHYAESLVNKFMENYVIHADWIILYNDYGEDKNENKTLLERVCTLLSEGEDFAKLKATYSEDTATNANSNGQYMRDGQYDETIEATAKSLEEGQLSNIIELPYGYLLVKRLDMNDEYIKENFHSEIVPYYQESMFEIMLQKLQAEQKVSYFDIYDSITVNSVE